MLLGRLDELLALKRLLAQAQSGHGGALGLVGEPGMGKTSLLDHIADEAAGMRVLRARGVESEAEIPFGGLAEILRPCLGALDQIPAPQADALAGALALRRTPSADRFAIGAATLSLLSASADNEPLLLLVDDVHWLDDSSAQALLFAARRLVADPVALVMAARDGERSILDVADLRVMRLAGLGQVDAQTLLAGAAVSPRQLDRLVTATGGNPLALLELASDPARLVTDDPSQPVPISKSIATAYLHRFGRLPESTRRLLVVAAASDDGDLVVVSQSAEALGLNVSDLAPAEDAQLINVVQGHVEFRHPLARAAVYANATAEDRRAAHEALANALPSGAGDRRAWHLAAASIGPNPRAVTALDEAGRRALQRSAYGEAAAAFERAATLASIATTRSHLLLDSANAAWLAGDINRTVARLDAANEGADLQHRAQIDYLRGQIALRLGPVGEGHRIMLEAASRIRALDPDFAVLMLAQAVLGAFCGGDAPAMLLAARRALNISERAATQRSTFLTKVAFGIALVADGQGERGAKEVREAVEMLEVLDELRCDPALLLWAASGALWLRESDVGRTVIEEAFDRARSQAAVGMLPSLLHIFARDQATTDKWSQAASSYDEAIRLARETGQLVELAAALAGASWLEARQGRERECRAHAAEAKRLCDDLGAHFYGAWTIQAVGDLELGLGHTASAIEHYRAQDAELRRLHLADVDLATAPELVEALARIGQPQEAEREARDYIVRANTKGQPWALARAARCEAMLAPPDEMRSHFERALQLHAKTPDVFEQARTRLLFGARLRRARQRVAARTELRAALQDFETLGATPWADQAAVELAATGETARRRDVSTLSQLTAQELQIARLLAVGKTTRETAAAVFISPKTVEYHLRHVYEKLEIHSRHELVQAMLPLM